jgi:hypothetical protein
MDMQKFKSEGNSTDLKAKDFIGKTLKLVIDRVESVTYPADEDKEEQTKAVLYFIGKEKRLVMNATNTGTLCTAYGNESEAWKGKEISLTTKDYTDKGYGHGWIVQPLEVDFDSDIPF